MASITARKKIVKEAGQPIEELEEQVAQVRVVFKIMDEQK